MDLSREALEKAASDLDGALLVAADVSKEEDVKAYVDQTVEAFGRIDVFVNNAGINGDFKPITEQTRENYAKVLDINVIGVALGLKYVVAQMQKQGSGAIVNTASNGGLLGAPGMSAYVASKHAVLGINKSVALEVAGDNIRVNAVCPSGVDTQMMRSIEANAMKGREEEARKQFESSVPLGRYAEADEIADLMLFLASDKASFITGAYYRIDGGGGATSV
ncbi:SDR family NAD(P)-dependent oxidoreductase [Allosediminivita pacifica]|uniref:NAD(P)-dependent dehydrogenase (Short-subunit alcohol dehydrogenase family) n=1 Tax=Allosediminivita pacifica TaxID=1267769 RepID=A0A2T6B0U3_9RHOB|nr:SDR family oxidoreductase [Allosediminivita pacifica]PTX49643.1 NAD(P)-dependent dehydrogenase (short-subunit alcohol dehydrogenase family) [Allosediminivita pacifica]GGB03472.1 short chain dehydrogenase [Allosediminivita pacifica]